METEQDYSTAETWFETKDRIISEIVASFAAHGRKRPKWFAPWKQLDGEKIAQIWLVYGKRGTIFDSEGLNQIADRMADLIARLSVCNNTPAMTVIVCGLSWKRNLGNRLPRANGKR